MPRVIDLEISLPKSEADPAIHLCRCGLQRLAGKT